MVVSFGHMPPLMVAIFETVQDSGFRERRCDGWACRHALSSRVDDRAEKRKLKILTIFYIYRHKLHFLTLPQLTPFPRGKYILK